MVGYTEETLLVYSWGRHFLFFKETASCFLLTLFILHFKSSSCLGLLTEPRSSPDGILYSSSRKKRAQSSTCWRRQYSSNSNIGNGINNFHSLDGNHSSGFIPADKKLVEGNLDHPPFVNEGAITWHQMRQEWIGDRSQRSCRRYQEPSNSWNTTNDNSRATSQPFTHPIPLSEMVELLVDLWQEEGLYG